MSMAWLNVAAVDDYNTIDRIHYVIKDRNDELLNIPVPIYISFIISVM